MMPGLDGFELLREIRAGVRTRELGSGADDHLPKPFSGRELVARVKAHLDMAKVRRQALDRADRGARRPLLDHARRRGGADIAILVLRAGAA